jgi:hypothetical protein
VIVGSCRLIARRPSVLDDLGHPGRHFILPAQTGLAPVVVGAHTSGYPEDPSVEPSRPGLVDVNTADGTHHGFAHGVLDVTGLHPPGDVSPEARVKPAVEHFPGGAVSGAGRADKGRLVKVLGLGMGQNSEMRQNCVKRSFS